MVRHILILKLRSDVKDRDKILSDMKREIQALSCVISTIRSVVVNTFPLASSSADILIECTFDDREALDAHKAHPAHIAAADKYIRPYIDTKLSFDTAE